MRWTASLRSPTATAHRSPRGLRSSVTDRNNNTTSYQYDELDLTQLGSTTYSYAGPGQSERVSANTTGFQHNILGLSREIGGLNAANYTRANDGQLISSRKNGDNAIRQYFLLDALGSVRTLVNTSGTVTRRYDYDPYGRQTSTTRTAYSRFRFASGEDSPSDCTSANATSTPTPAAGPSPTR